MKTLIVIDMQNDFVTGSLGTKEAVAILPKVKAKIKEYASNGDIVIFTADTHYDNYLLTREGRCLPIPHCIAGTEGCKIVEGLEPPHPNASSLVLSKSAFGYTKWMDWAHYMKEIEIVGVCTDICVVSNALILRSLFLDARITVDASCCAGTTPEAHKAALTVMRSCHIDVIGE